MMLFKDISVIDAAVSVGFASSGGFNKAFRKEMAIAPSYFSKLKDKN